MSDLATPPAPPAPPPDWKATLPDDLKANASLATIKDVNDLAKGYVNAQSLIGAKRIALPKENATEVELGEFYKALGRPEAADKYSDGTVKPLDSIVLDKTVIAKTKDTFFKLGLTDTQQKGVMDYYFSGLNEGHQTFAKNMEVSKAEAENALKEEWGDKFNANLGVVKNVLRHFGDEKVAVELEGPIGNNLALTKMLFKFGTTLMEDKSTREKFSIPTNTPTAALQRLNELKSDATFQKALNTNSDPGHQAAVELWTQVHRQLGV